jgi:clan AA aspartic protease (TIGR02281 family)
MGRLVWAVAVVVLCCGAAPCQLVHWSSVPLIEAEGGTHLLVDATLDGTPVRLMVDTGATAIAINERVANRATSSVPIGSMLPGSDEIAHGFSAGVGGARASTLISINRLGLGQASGSFRAEAIDFDFSRQGDHADGLLGMPVLGLFDVDLDVPGHEMRLFKVPGGCPNPVTNLDQPIYGVRMVSRRDGTPGLQILVPVTIDGQNLTALLDTGAPDTVIFESAAAKLGLDKPQAGLPTELKMEGIGGTAMMHVRVLPAMTVGPLTFSNVPVEVDPENLQGVDMLLGLRFMRKVHVWLSNSSHTLVMQYPPLPSPPLQLAH